MLCIGTCPPSLSSGLLISTAGRLSTRYLLKPFLAERGGIVARERRCPSAIALQRHLYFDEDRLDKQTSVAVSSRFALQIHFLV